MLERAKSFSIKQIAAQAGMSKATVDRVLHGRAGISPRTRRRIEQALGELEAQERSGLAVGRSLYVDIVMHTPRRFSEAVREAINAQLYGLAPLRVFPRLHLYEDIGTPELCALIQRCARTGSHGLILKAPDVPQINLAVDQLSQAGVPVVTLVTDLPQSRRVGYVGMDNRTAGQTAAYLLSRWLEPVAQDVAVVIGSVLFRGEEEREMGFRTWLRQRSPHLGVIEISGGYGVYGPTLERVGQALEHHPRLQAVYSVGGGNRAIVEAFARAGRPLRVLIGHDLDAENRELLAQERIDAIIDHDLQQDARQAFMHILRHHRLALPGPLAASQVRVVTPFNMPA